MDTKAEMQYPNVETTENFLLDISFQSIVNEIQNQLKYRPGTTKITLRRHICNRLVAKMEEAGFKVKKTTRERYGRTEKITKIRW